MIFIIESRFYTYKYFNSYLSMDFFYNNTDLFSKTNILSKYPVMTFSSSSTVEIMY